MKKLTIVLAGSFLAVACNQPAANPEETGESNNDTTSSTQAETKVEPSLEMAWETDTVLTTNESVLYDPDGQMLYVSNIAGQPTDEDGVGFISRLGTDGEVKDLKWVSGLDAPKGMAIHEGMLYVTNIDELVEIELSSGEIANRYPVEGASFLNDVAVGSGMIYFSDMSTGKLHFLSDGKVSTMKEGLEGINGLAYNSDEGSLYMLTGKGMQKMSLDGTLSLANDKVTGGDGLVIIDNDTYLASRWKGEIWLIDQGEATKLLDTKDQEIQTADIGYIPEEKLVLVPRFFSNKVTAYKLDY